MRLSLASIGAVRARLSLTPQKPLPPSLPTRSPPDGTLEGRDLPRDLTPSQVGRRRSLLLGRVGRWRQCGVWNDVRAKGHRSDRYQASVRASAHVGRRAVRRAVRAKVSELGSRRTCVLLLRLQMTADGSLARLVKTFASTQNIFLSVLFTAQPEGHVRSTVVGADQLQLLGHRSSAFTATS